jgi:hypothetical protein
MNFDRQVETQATESDRVGLDDIPSMCCESSTGDFGELARSI